MKIGIFEYFFKKFLSGNCERVRSDLRELDMSASLLGTRKQVSRSLIYPLHLAYSLLIFYCFYLKFFK